MRPRSLPPMLGAFVRSLKDPRTRLGLAITLFVLAVAIGGPLLAPESPAAFVGPPFAHPSSAALLGTDYLGHDVLSRVLWGGRSVVWMSVASTLLGMLIGVAVGLAAGYTKSRLSDDLVMGGTSVILAFPQIVLVLLFVAMAGPKLWLIVLLVAMSHAPRVARVTRGLTVELRTREYVEACEALAVRRRTILTREILPNMLTPLMVEFGLRLTWSVGLVAGISFLGFGIQPPNADWGLMIHENRNGLTVQPWAVLMPILGLVLFAIGTNLLTEGFARAVSGVDARSRH